MRSPMKVVRLVPSGSPGHPSDVIASPKRGVSQSTGLHNETGHGPQPEDPQIRVAVPLTKAVSDCLTHGLCLSHIPDGLLLPFGVR